MRKIIMVFITTFLLNIITSLHMTLYVLITPILRGDKKTRLAMLICGAAAVAIILRYPSFARIGLYILLAVECIISLVLTLDYLSWKNKKKPALPVFEIRQKEEFAANRFSRMKPDKAKLEYKRLTNELTNEDGYLDLEKVGEIAGEYSRFLNKKR